MRKTALRSIKALLYIGIVYLAVAQGLCFAKEITIIYSGETHAMLYPCSCPREPDGGIARRASLVKQLRKQYPGALVLDSGGFFAAGLLDEYTQNTRLDQARSLVNLKAMELMRYDAASVGDDEFNFGRKFLEENAAKVKVPLLSANAKEAGFAPYIIKDVSGTKAGIIGVTSLAAQTKAEGLEFSDPQQAVKKSVEELKKKGAQIIILLSHLGVNEDLSLAKEVPGIDVIISGHTSSKELAQNKPGSTLIFMPSWQGRRLGKVTLQLKDGKIAGFKQEDLRLSDEVGESPEIAKILPQCFSDNDCKKKGFRGRCSDAGSGEASCVFNKAAKVNLLVVTSRACLVCDTKDVIGLLKKMLPGLTVAYLYYPEAKSQALVKDTGAKGLPLYLLSKDVETEKGFSGLKAQVEEKGGYYMLKPQYAGISYFLARPKIKGKFDLFISLFDKDTAKVLQAVKDFKPEVHFLAIRGQDKFEAAKGNIEVEEYLRASCVRKYYPEIFWDYISCRANNIDSSWWEDCLGKFDPGIIRQCSRSQEGALLLEENIRLNKEIEVMFGPAYLADNVEAFATDGVPAKKELEKIIKR